jgi:hypothetical protein
MKRALVGMSIAAVAASACALVVDLSDLSGSGDASTDASSDLVAMDAPEAAPDVRFCVSRADAGDTFCDDFDEGDPVSVGWSGTSTFGSGAAVTLADASFVSPPYSAHAHLDSQGNFATLYEKPVPMAMTVALVDTDIMPPVIDAGYVNILSLELLGGRYPSLTLRQYANLSSQIIETYLGPDGGVVTAPGHGFSSALEQGAWSHVQVELVLGDAGAGKATLVVYVNDGGVVDDPLQSAAQYQPAQVNVSEGVLQISSVSGPVDVYFDNVIIDVR